MTFVCKKKEKKKKWFIWRFFNMICVCVIFICRHLQRRELKSPQLTSIERSCKSSTASKVSNLLTFSPPAGGTCAAALFSVNIYIYIFYYLIVNFYAENFPDWVWLHHSSPHPQASRPKWWM